MNLLIIALGGALGSVMRFLSYGFVFKIMRGSSFSMFPFNTMFVNIVGSFLAGVLYYFMVQNFDNFDARLKGFLMVGFLGGFTTFSSFSLDFLRLVNASQHGFAFLYAALSLVLSILAIFFGFYLMKVIL